MKKAFKIIYIYTGVILLALLATIVFCAAFLFFYREGNIFGIQYVSMDKYVYAKEDEDMSSLKNIEINSGSFEVRVKINPNVDSLMGAMRIKVFGFAKTMEAQSSFSLEYNEVTNTAVFNSVQPKGLLNKSKSFIEIAIPKSLSDAGVNVSIKTSKGAIRVGGEYDWTINHLDIITKKGKAVVSNIDLISSINLDVGSGSIYLDDECSTLSSVNATINVGSGKINLAKTNIDNFALGIVEIKTIKRGEIGIIKADELITNGNIAGGGKLEIGEVKFVDFSSLDTDIKINKITGNSLSKINITGLGDIFINTSQCKLEINGHNGDIHINTSVEIVSLLSNQGDIKIDNAFKSISAITSYGNIEINFNESSFSYAMDSNSRTAFATTKNGHIIINGLENGNIKATGNGRISLNYNKILGNNEVSSQYGIINIIVPNSTNVSNANEYAFNLQVDSAVNSDIKVGVVGSLGVDFNGSGLKEFNNIYNSGFSTSNNLKVSSAHNMIKIRSRDLINY